ncbi:protein PTCD3 homolog, mitochondrial [Octopus sinensis]|uniref:Small ribosomal subunit protein mS39 n=1 Tax=Octopus sinensis TaxID=2607531 RepID=A0A6P7T6R9_9MOLL|nr:protein PTCD3 homolog, mitochondrial [Octopus sinensis]
MSSTILSLKSLSKLAACCHLKQTVMVISSCQVVTQTKEKSRDLQKIVIPKRIKRGPTDILDALSQTVGKDYTAPAYRYIDDPYLIPTSTYAKRIYALSKASGRKTANYMLQKFPKNFSHNPAVPHVPSFMPHVEKGFHKAPANESTLLECVKLRKVTSAMAVYDRVLAGGATVSSDVFQQLLDLLCIYNCQNVEVPLTPEEYFYQRDLDSSRNQRSIKNTWKQDGMAEKIFNDMTEKTPEAYCSLIQGAAKYYNMERAFNLYDEMKGKKLPVSLSAYNSLLHVAVYHGDTYPMKWNLILNLLKDMKSSKLQPNLATFNAVLNSLSRMTRFGKCRMIAHNVLTEMKNCGIEPSLASWSMFINIIYFNENVESQVIYQIMDHLKDKEMTLQHPADFDFFANAMAKCYIQIKDLELAYKIDEFLHCGSNYKFLGDAFKEGIYYSFFFRLICQFETLEKIMYYYDLFAPNMWTPNTLALSELLKAIQLHDGQEHLPRIWSDLVMFQFTRGEETGTIFKLMADESRPELLSQFADVAVKIIERWTEENDANIREFIVLTGELLGNMMVIVMKADRFSDAWNIFQLYEKHSPKLSNVPSESAMSMLLDGCLNEKHTKNLLQCVKTMNKIGYMIPKDKATKIKEELQLSEKDRYILDMCSSSVKKTDGE